MKTASIEQIVSIQPHPNADRLELAQVLGWQCVVRKGEFSAGQEIVYVPIDTILPEAPWTAFLAGKLRVKTIKLRGSYSQGLVFPLSILPEGVQGWHIGADVGGALGVRKYEKEVPAQLSGTMRGSFPSFIVSKTDEDNGLSNPALVAEVLSHECVVTQKLDGSSCTIVVRDGKIEHVCSRNVDLVEDESNAFWKVAKKGTYGTFTGVLQGELMGPGIQGNQLELAEPELFLFQVRNADGVWQRPHDGFFGFPACPVVYTGRLTLAEVQDLADAQKLPNGQPAEGVVARPTHLPASGVGRPLGFKIINRGYGE